MRKLTLICALVATAALAHADYVTFTHSGYAGKLYYSSCDGGVSVNSVVIGDGSTRSLIRGEFVIPDELGGRPVVAIGKSAFSDCTGVTRFHVPATVTSIGDNAFSGCFGMTELPIPAGVTSIGNSAFSGCSAIRELVLPAGVKSISSYAFEKCGFRSVRIPDHVEVVGPYAFYQCMYMTDAYVPDSVTNIATTAFHRCEALKSVRLAPCMKTLSGWFKYDYW